MVESTQPTERANHSINRADHGSDRSEGLTGRDLAEIVGLLKRKLAWYGFRSIALGPVIKVQEHMISIDLMVGGGVVGRIEVERRSGVIKRWLPFHLVPD